MAAIRNVSFLYFMFNNVNFYNTDHHSLRSKSSRYTVHSAKWRLVKSGRCFSDRHFSLRYIFSTARHSIGIRSSNALWSLVLSINHLLAQLTVH